MQITTTPSPGIVAVVRNLELEGIVHQYFESGGSAAGIREQITARHTSDVQ